MTRTVLQLRRGTQVQHSSFVGQVGEVTVDTTRKTVVVHDGVNAGGNTLAPLVSPAFTGVPTAPTASTGTNNSQIATTAFVAQTIATVGSGPVNTDALVEGSTNRYFTNARARAAISVTGSLGYDANTGVISYSQPLNVSTFVNDAGYLTTSNVRDQLSATGSITYNTSTGVFSFTDAVTSVNGLTGVINLTTINVTESGNLYYTDARARAAISVTGPNLSYSSGLITSTHPIQLSNVSNDSVVLGTNLLTVTINNSIKLRQDANKLATSRIQGFDTTAGSNGTTLTITGGDGGVGSGNGGPLVLQGGTTVDGDGASVTITATDGIGSLRNAGSITLNAGVPGDGGIPGNLRGYSRGVIGFYQSLPSTGTDFGSVVIGSIETLPGTPNAGGIYIHSAKAQNTSTAIGGLIDFRSSTGTVGGSVTFLTGNGTSGNGGDVSIITGQGSGSGNRGGNITIQAGIGVSSASSGNIIMNSNCTVSTGSRITHLSAPTTDFHVTNRRYVRSTTLAFSIALS